MHGLIGESSHFDILEAQGMMLVIRIQAQDVNTFSLGLSGYTFDLDALIGSSVLPSELKSRIGVSGSSPYLGLAVPM